MSKLVNTIITPSMEAHARRVRRIAESGIWNGENMRSAYFQRCGSSHVPTNVHMIFMRETGYHSSGWWKNPDYERCYHLSLSFHNFIAHTAAAYDQPIAKAWVSLLFGEAQRYIWEEGPAMKRRQGDSEVRHYRVFCDLLWQPIIPRGEVYTKQFTERGWLSWSDARYAEQKQAEDNQS